jgi:rhodanese-related sulfurtransferase
VRGAASSNRQRPTRWRVSLEEFKELLDANSILVIDTRDTASYVAGHIPGAVSVPLDRVTDEARKLQAAGKPIVAYCA